VAADVVWGFRIPTPSLSLLRATDKNESLIGHSSPNWQIHHSNHRQKHRDPPTRRPITEPCFHSLLPGCR